MTTPLEAGARPPTEKQRIGVVARSAAVAAKIRRTLPGVHAWTWDEGICGLSFDAIIVAAPADTDDKLAQVACLWTKLRPGGALIEA